jgi:hypothetical protein
MFDNTFSRKQFPQQKVKKEKCEISFKKTPNGGYKMSFTPSCTKEQIEMAKLQLDNGEVDDEE